MYNHQYNAIVTNGIASMVNTKVLLNKEASIVKDPDDAFGLPTQYLLQQPEKIIFAIFVDEVGSNTSTAMDGHAGCGKFLCDAIGLPKIKTARNLQS
jgi:hypothetical protein